MYLELESERISVRRLVRLVSSRSLRKMGIPALDSQAKVENLFLILRKRGSFFRDQNFRISPLVL